MIVSLKVPKLLFSSYIQGKDRLCNWLKIDFQAESLEGRSWMLRKENLDDTLTKISSLLANENSWTASNSALVLARLVIT